MASSIFKLLQAVQDSFNQKMSFPDELESCREHNGQLWWGWSSWSSTHNAARTVQQIWSKISEKVSKIMNYISNYWTQRTSNKRSHSWAVGTQPCLMHEYPTLITQYISFTLQFLKWLDTAVQGGDPSTWVTLLGNITFYRSCGVGGPNFESQNFLKSRYENFDEIAS